MGDTWNVNAGITERFKKLDCPESEKKVLQDYLISCLAEGKNFPLKRNRVMIMEEKNKNKYIVLDVVRTSVVNKQFYICPKCSRMEFCELLTNSVMAEQYKSCLHSELCKLIWGDDFDLHVDDEEIDLVQVVTEKPQYLAVVKQDSQGSGYCNIDEQNSQAKVSSVSWARQVYTPNNTLPTIQTWIRRGIKGKRGWKENKGRESGT